MGSSFSLASGGSGGSGNVGDWGGSFEQAEHFGLECSCVELVFDQFGSSHNVADLNLDTFVSAVNEFCDKLVTLHFGASPGHPEPASVVGEQFC